jgi:hypothetical protein
MLNINFNYLFHSISLHFFEEEHIGKASIQYKETDVEVFHLISNLDIFSICLHFTKICNDVFGLDLLAIILGQYNLDLCLHFLLVSSHNANVETLISEVSAILFTNTIGAPSDYCPCVFIAILTQ